MKISRVIVDDKLWLNLRKCQRESLQTAFKFLDNKEIEKSCLICLPTGAGKTGVITVLSHYSRQKKILVVSHRRAVLDQILKELDGGFFGKISDEIKIKKNVFNLSDNYALDDGIYVTSFQKLTLLSSDDLHILKENIDLLIIDEGHSEPSPIWSQISRGLAAKK